MWKERRKINDDPWSHAVRLVMKANTATGRFIKDLISQEKDDVDEKTSILRAYLAASKFGSRRSTYGSLNPDFTVARWNIPGEVPTEMQAVLQTE